MPRMQRMQIVDEPTVYHVINRTALPGLPMGEEEKAFLLQMLQRLVNKYFIEIFGFCFMGNHFHLLLRTRPETDIPDALLAERLRLLLGDSAPDPHSPQGIRLRSKLVSINPFIQELKQAFSRFYNKRHQRRGFFWGERYKSVIVEPGHTLLHCLAYIDLNPVRAGLVQRPQEYGWCSLGYHKLQGNKDGLLSMRYDYEDWKNVGQDELLAKYEDFVAATGALDPEYASAAGGATDKRTGSEDITRADRFRKRTRYFTDSGFIGSKTFVLKNIARFAGDYDFNANRQPKKVKGLEEIYSLRRLSELL